MTTQMKFHLGYFTKFGATDWPNKTGQEVGASWANGRVFIEQAVELERAKFDFVMFEDSLTVSDTYGSSMELDLKNAVSTPKHDPIPLLPLLAHSTSRIGFIATASTSFYPPYLLARLFSTVDSLSGGRVGWNIVTSSETNAARNFGMDSLPGPVERYDRAEEYVDLACELWESWEEGAVVADPSTGVFVDHTKVHVIDFEGEHYRSRGPLNTMRSPQGTPVLCQAGASSRGRDFAAKYAEVIVALKSGGIEGMRALREDIRARMKTFDRNPDSCKLLYLSPISFTSGGPEDAVAMSDLEATAMLESNLVMGSSAMDLDLSLYDLDGPVDQDMQAGGHTSVLDGIKEAGRYGMTLRQAMSAAGTPEETDFIGTPEEVAEQMIAVMDQVGGDGYLIQGAGSSAQLPVLIDEVIPALQAAGAVRAEYTGSTLREVLNEF